MGIGLSDAKDEQMYEDCKFWINAAYEEVDLWPRKIRKYRKGEIPKGEAPGLYLQKNHMIGVFENVSNNIRFTIEALEKYGQELSSVNAAAQATPVPSAHWISRIVSRSFTGLTAAVSSAAFAAGKLINQTDGKQRT